MHRKILNTNTNKLEGIVKAAKWLWNNRDDPHEIDLRGWRKNLDDGCIENHGGKEDEVE
jgi:acylphosphatase